MHGITVSVSACMASLSLTHHRLSVAPDDGTDSPLAAAAAAFSRRHTTPASLASFLPRAAPPAKGSESRERETEGGREREREREGERGSERERERDRDRQTDRDSDRERVSEREREREERERFPAS